MNREVAILAIWAIILEVIASICVSFLAIEYLFEIETAYEWMSLNTGVTGTLIGSYIAITGACLGAIFGESDDAFVDFLQANGGDSWYRVCAAMGLGTSLAALICVLITSTVPYNYLLSLGSLILLVYSTIQTATSIRLIYNYMSLKRLFKRSKKK